MNTMILPATIVLSSTAVGRGISYQADPARPELLISVVPDVTTATQMLAVCNSRVAAVVLNGAVGDTYSVLPFIYS